MSEDNSKIEEGKSIEMSNLDSSKNSGYHKIDSDKVINPDLTLKGLKL